MTRCSIEPGTRKCVKGYGFYPSREIYSTNIGKN